MNASIPLYAVLLGVLIAAVVTAVLYIFYRWGKALADARQRLEAATLALHQVSVEVSTLRATLPTVTAAIDRVSVVLHPACEELKTHMAGIPTLLEGITKIATAQMEMMALNRAREEEKEKHPYGRVQKPNSSPADQVTAEMEHEIQGMMRARGIPRELALAELNGANAQSVYGGGFFEGWAGR